jgi:hypothetical protein
VLSTNTATSSIARFDLHAKPASGTTSGQAILSVTSEHDDSSVDLVAGSSKDATISFHGSNADKFIVGSDGSTHLYEVQRAAMSTTVADYEGSASVTVNGRLCQKWSSQTPHTHSYGSTGDHNFCRDPSSSGTLWCYTTDPSVATENCADPNTAKALMTVDGSGNMAIAGGAVFEGAVVAASVCRHCTGGNSRDLHYTSRHCYEYHTTPKSYFDAHAVCAAGGGHLVQLMNSDEENFVENVVASTSATFWIGYTDAEVSTQWRWMTGEVAYASGGVYSSWASNEPATSNDGTPRCAAKTGDTWASVSCSNTNNFVCERP